MALHVSIRKKLESFLLDVSFETQEGVLALLGASGCGKSMTLKCIAGIEKPDSGKIVLNDKVLFDSSKKIDLPPQKRKVGYLFQNYALFPNMTVIENIMSGIHLQKKERLRIANEKIEAFYLQGLEKRYPFQLSGGQQQRTALARIMASSPEILLLDEPFSALDSYLKWQLEIELRELLDKYHNSAVFVSHDRDEVYRICDNIAVISNGTINAFDEKWALFKNPRTLAASVISGCKNHSEARKISDYEIEAIDWGVVFTANTKVPDTVKHIGIRAHFFELSTQKGINSFECTIERVIEDTFSFIVILKSKNGKSSSSIRWELSKEKWMKLDKKRLFLKVDPENLLFLC